MENVNIIIDPNTIEVDIEVGAGANYTFTELNDLTSTVIWANVPSVNITEQSVTQHESALSITESQISDLSHFTPSTLFTDYGFTDNSSNWNSAFSWGDHSLEGYITEEFNDLTDSVVWANVPDVNITESSVIQHETALSILESQITDLDVVHKTGNETVGGIKTFTGGVNVNGVRFKSYNDGNNLIEFRNIAGSLKGYTGYLDGVGFVYRNDVSGNSLTLADSGNLTYTSGIYGSSFIKAGGTSAQFLKADGSIDSNTYLTSIGAHTHAWSDITSGKPTTLAGYGITDAMNRFNGTWSGDWNTTQPSGFARFTGILNNPWGGTHSTILTVGEVSGNYGWQITNKNNVSTEFKVRSYNTAPGTWYDLAIKDISGYLTATGFKVPSGTASGFLKANGSVDTGDYLLTANAPYSFKNVLTGFPNTSTTNDAYREGKIGLNEPNPVEQLDLIGSFKQEYTYANGLKFRAAFGGENINSELGFPSGGVKGMNIDVFPKTGSYEETDGIKLSAFMADVTGVGQAYSLFGGYGFSNNAGTTYNRLQLFRSTANDESYSSSLQSYNALYGSAWVRNYTVGVGDGFDKEPLVEIRLDNLTEANSSYFTPHVSKIGGLLKVSSKYADNTFKQGYTHTDNYLNTGTLSTSLGEPKYSLTVDSNSNVVVSSVPPMQQRVVELSSADISTLFTTPIVIIEAKAGYIPTDITGTVIFDYTAPTFGLEGGDGKIHLVAVGGSLYYTVSNVSCINNGSDLNRMFTNAALNNLTSGTALELRSSTDPSGGGSSATVIINFRWQAV